MLEILIVDPLDLELAAVDGVPAWSSRSCFERAFEGIDGIELAFASARAEDLCARAARSDGVVIGGSEASAWEDTAFNDHLLDLIAICWNNAIPLLGICFGAQLLGRAIGGDVGPHPAGIELGAPKIELTREGLEHDMFKGVNPLLFHAIETHNDAIFRLPESAVLLASTEHAPVQAFSFKGLLWGVQFHPEMDADDLRQLWRGFAAKGIVGEASHRCQGILDATRCGQQRAIFWNFVERVKVPSESI